MKLSDLATFKPEDDINIDYDEDDVLLDRKAPMKRRKPCANKEGCHRTNKNEEMELRIPVSDNRARKNISRKVNEDIYDRDPEFSTTFWQDFTIADKFGVNAVKDTFNRAFEEWKDDYKYLTDLVIVLNWKLWDWYEKDDKMADAYYKAYNKAHRYALTHLKGDELSYFYRVTD